MANAPIDPLRQTVNLRGLMFPAQGIRDMMAQTGGIVVSDEEINQELDAAIHTHLARGKLTPSSLVIEAFPLLRFVPFKVKVHRGPEDIKGSPTNKYLYFAVQRVF